MTTLQELIEQWEARSKDALPTDAMLINKHIRELRTALAQQGERKNCPQPEICGSKECEFCRDTAAPAQKPVAYITQTEQGPMVWTPEMYNEACTYCDDGEFPIPLYTAAPAPQAQDKSDNYLSGYCTGRTDLLKEQSAQPVAQPLAKTCDTCAHYQQGKHPGVSIHDETCYECSEYYGSRWEAAHGIREVK